MVLQPVPSKAVWAISICGDRILSAQLQKKVGVLRELKLVTCGRQVSSVKVKVRYDGSRGGLKAGMSSWRYSGSV